MPAASATCPNCGTAVTARRPLGRSLLAVAGAGVAAVTLMACYGGPEMRSPPCEDGTYDCYYQQEEDGGMDAGEIDGGLTDGGLTDGGEG